MVFDFFTSESEQVHSVRLGQGFIPRLTCGNVVRKLNGSCVFSRYCGVLFLQKLPNILP